MKKTQPKNITNKIQLLKATELQFLSDKAN